jgi:hypothetical protein
MRTLRIRSSWIAGAAAASRWLAAAAAGEGRPSMVGLFIVSNSSLSEPCSPAFAFAD